MARPRSLMSMARPKLAPLEAPAAPAASRHRNPGQEFNSLLDQSFVDWEFLRAMDSKA
jgi:hypothetical protein